MIRMVAATIVLVAGLALFWQADAQPGSTAETKPPRESMLRHVVLFKFKSSVTPDQIQRVLDQFAALPKKISAIIDFEMGADVSVENKSKGFTHCFLVTFRDEKGRDAYLPHPEHVAFVEILRPLLEDVLVFDYKVER